MFRKTNHFAQTIVAGALSCGLLCASNSTLAACDGHSCRNAEITRLVVGATGVDVRVDHDSNLLDVCDPGPYRYLTLHKTHAAFAEIYSALLAFYLSGQRIWLRMSDSGDPADSCSIQYIVADK